MHHRFYCILFSNACDIVISLKTHYVNLSMYSLTGGSIQNRQIGRPPTIGRVYSQVNKPCHEETRPPVFRSGYVNLSVICLTVSRFCRPLHNRTNKRSQDLYETVLWHNRSTWFATETSLNIYEPLTSLY